MKNENKDIDDDNDDDDDNNMRTNKNTIQTKANVFRM